MTFWLWFAFTLYLLASCLLWVLFLEAVKIDQRRRYDYQRGEMLVELHDHQWRYFLAWLILWPGMPFIALARHTWTRRKK